MQNHTRLQVAWSDSDSKDNLRLDALSIQGLCTSRRVQLLPHVNPAYYVVCSSPRLSPLAHDKTWGKATTDLHPSSAAPEA
jgi:hypothetical protein